MNLLYRNANILYLLYNTNRMKRTPQNQTAPIVIKGTVKEEYFEEQKVPKLITWLPAVIRLLIAPSTFSRDVTRSVFSSLFLYARNLFYIVAVFMSVMIWLSQSEIHQTMNAFPESGVIKFENQHITAESVTLPYTFAILRSTVELSEKNMTVIPLGRESGTNVAYADLFPGEMKFEITKPILQDNLYAFTEVIAVNLGLSLILFLLLMRSIEMLIYSFILQPLLKLFFGRIFRIAALWKRLLFPALFAEIVSLVSVVLYPGQQIPMFEISLLAIAGYFFMQETHFKLVVIREK